MNGKKARKLRKMLELKRSKLEPTEFQVAGTRRVGIIDGVNGNHRVEEREFKQLFCDENKRLYRRLKEELKDSKSTIGKQLLDDLAQINEG